MSVITNSDESAASLAAPRELSAEALISARRRALVLMGGFATGAVLSACGGGGGGESAVSQAVAQSAPDSPGTAIYDLTVWGAVASDPSADAASAFSEIFSDASEQGHAGIEIIVPPGVFYLNSRVVIKRSFVKIRGTAPGWATGTGFRGGSVFVINNPDGGFYVDTPTPRPSGSDGRCFSVGFEGMAIDGQVAAARRIGIQFGHASLVGVGDNDACYVTQCAIKECAVAVRFCGADAALVAGNRLVENINCMEFLRAGKANLINQNFLGGKPDNAGLSKAIYAENQERLMITGNQMFPDAEWAIELSASKHSLISGNLIQSYGKTAIAVTGNTSESISIEGNHMMMHPPTSPGSSRPYESDSARPVLALAGQRHTVSTNTLQFVAKSTSDMAIEIEGDGHRLLNNSIQSKVLGFGQPMSEMNKLVVINTQASEASPISISGPLKTTNISTVADCWLSLNLDASPTQLSL